MRRAIAAFAFSALALAGCQSDTESTPVTSNTGSAFALADLVGARGSSGEMELQARGYQMARTEGLTAYWWNPGSGTCARVVTGDGRYQSVDPVSPSQCGQAGRTPKATTAVAGGPPPDIADMVGARAGQAEMGMNSRGYTAARTKGLTTFWWNQATGVCAKIVTADGRYKTVNTVTPGDCAG